MSSPLLDRLAEVAGRALWTRYAWVAEASRHAALLEDGATARDAILRELAAAAPEELIEAAEASYRDAYDNTHRNPHLAGLRAASAILLAKAALKRHEQANEYQCLLLDREAEIQRLTSALEADTPQIEHLLVQNKQLRSLALAAEQRAEEARTQHAEGYEWNDLASAVDDAADEFDNQLLTPEEKAQGSDLSTSRVARMAANVLRALAAAGGSAGATTPEPDAVHEKLHHIAARAPMPVYGLSWVLISPEEREWLCGLARAGATSEGGLRSLVDAVPAEHKVDERIKAPPPPPPSDHNPHVGVRMP